MSLSETGRLILSYMGTSPPLNVVGGFEGKVGPPPPLFVVSRFVIAAEIVCCLGEGVREG